MTSPIEVLDISNRTVGIFRADFDERIPGALESYWSVDSYDRQSIRNYLREYRRVDFGAIAEEARPRVRSNLQLEARSFERALLDRGFPYEQGLKAAWVEWPSPYPRFLFEEAYRFFYDNLLPQEGWLGFSLKAASELGIPDWDYKPMNFTLHMPRPGTYDPNDIAFVSMLVDRLTRFDATTQRVEFTGGAFVSNNGHLRELLSMLFTSGHFNELLDQVNLARFPLDGEGALGELRAAIGNREWAFQLFEKRPPPNFIWEISSIS